MMVGSGGINGGEGQQQQVAVPPGFRFHPTDEELLYYYLRKKICYEAIDLDVIREVDLNKLEPWDLKERCRIGSGPQNEWYFFSHKDKKYPTGTRTNRATTVGFWKATGRDKAIVQQQSHVASGSSSRRRRRIGMRKTLVFYTGRAPHGQKTDWIMHEYRLLLDDPHPTNPDPIQEEGWVVCRVFKKKNPSRVSSSSLFPPNCHEPAAGEDEEADHEDHQLQAAAHHKMNVAAGENINPKQSSFLLQLQQAHPYVNYLSNSTCSLFGGGTNYNNMINMHLPQLLTSPDHHHPTSSPAAAEAPSIGHTLVMMNNHDHNLDHPVISSSCGCTRAGGGVQPINNVHDHPGPHSQQFTTNGAADWSFLDKLLASSHHQSSTGTGLGHEQGLGLDHHQVSKFNQLQQIIPSNSQPAVILGRDDHHHAPNLSQMFPFQYLGHQD